MNEELLAAGVPVRAHWAADRQQGPIILKFGLPAMGLPLAGATAEHINHLFVGALIIFFLIVEPHGLARLWSIAKQKLRLWPFPH